MKDFIYDIPTKVYFGRNQLGHMGEELLQFGKKVLLVYGGGSIKRTGLYDKVTAELKKAGITWVELPGIDPNPRIDSVRKGAALCKENKIDAVLAVGGGSVGPGGRGGDYYIGRGRDGGQSDYPVPVSPDAG